MGSIVEAPSDVPPLWDVGGCLSCRLYAGVTLSDSNQPRVHSHSLSFIGSRCQQMPISTMPTISAWVPFIELFFESFWNIGKRLMFWNMIHRWCSSLGLNWSPQLMKESAAASNLASYDVLDRNTKEYPRTPVWSHWTHYKRVKVMATLFPRIMRVNLHVTDFKSSCLESEVHTYASKHVFLYPVQSRNSIPKM
jgi:hypothetical protein